MFRSEKFDYNDKGECTVTNLQIFALVAGVNKSGFWNALTAFN